MFHVEKHSWHKSLFFFLNWFQVRMEVYSDIALSSPSPKNSSFLSCSGIINSVGGYHSLNSEFN